MNKIILVVLMLSGAMQAQHNYEKGMTKAEWDMGSAAFFGTSIEPYCKEVQRAIDLFATFKPETPFHPNYGLERAQELIKECKGQ